jgi:hypothetical protein
MRRKARGGTPGGPRQRAVAAGRGGRRREQGAAEDLGVRARGRWRVGRWRDEEEEVGFGVIGPLWAVIGL